LFPVFLSSEQLSSEQHWITFKLDFESNELSYGKITIVLEKHDLLGSIGDSLSHKGMKPLVPKEAIRKIQWWLKSRFNRVFKELGDELQHGDQEDYTDWNPDREHRSMRAV
jgi:hypothetical protein